MAQTSNVIPLRASESSAEGRGLSDCVLQSVRQYFDDLGDHEPKDLHRFVMQECERPLLTEVLARADGNQTRAAQLLGISRGTLRKKIKAFNLK